MKKYVLTSWYYNPIHPGHVECFQLASELWDELWVIINNDEQAFLKRGVKSFQDEEFRMKIVWSIRYVDNVILSIDNEKWESGEIPQIKTMKLVAWMIREKDPDATIIFAKWWDRSKDLGNIPEADVCRECGISIVDGLGEKTHHSRNYITVE